MLQGQQTTGEPMQLSSGSQEKENNNSEDFHDDGKMKLSSDFGPSKWNCIVVSYVENIRQVGQ